MITLASRSPRIVAKEVHGGFEVAFVAFVPFVIFGLAMLATVVAVTVGRRVWQAVKPMYIAGWFVQMVIRAAVMPLERG